MEANGGVLFLLSLGFLSAVWEVGGEYVSVDVVGGWGISSQEKVLTQVATEFLNLAAKLGFILALLYAAKHYRGSNDRCQSRANHCPSSSEPLVAGDVGQFSEAGSISETESVSIEEETDYPEILAAAELFFIHTACRIHGTNKSRVCAKEMSINWFKQRESFVELQPHFEVSLNPVGREKTVEKCLSRNVDRLVVVLGLEGTLVKTWKERSNVAVPYGDVPYPHKANIRNLRIEPFRVKGCVGVVRPGAREFLEKIATFADIYIYTLWFNRNVAKRIMGVLSGGGHKLFKGLETRSIHEKGMKDLMVFERNMERTVLVDHQRKVKQSSHSISIDEFKGDPLDGYLMDQVFPIIQAVNSLDRVYVDGGRHYSEALEAAYSKSTTSDGGVEEKQE